MSIRLLTRIILLVYAILSIYNLLVLVLGLTYHDFYTPLLTLNAFLFALLHSSQNLGWRRAFLFLLLSFAVSLLFESVGVATGWFYGPYHYTDKLGPKFLGLVPLLIPIAWFMMTYPAYVIAGCILPVLRSIWAWRFALAALGAIIMTAWDLAMDPLMVAGGHWVWEQPGAYFGVPLQNYWGWWLTIFVTFLLFLLFARVGPEKSSPDDRFNRLAVWSYIVTGLSTILIDFTFRLDGPALVGLFAMLPWAVGGFSLRKFTAETAEIAEKDLDTK